MGKKFRDGQTLVIPVLAADAVGDFKMLGRLCFNIFSKETATATSAVGKLQGVFKVTKKGADGAWTIGIPLYFDAAAKEFTLTAGNRQIAGYAAAAAGASDTEGQILLNGLPAVFGP